MKNNQPQQIVSERLGDGTLVHPAAPLLVQVVGLPSGPQPQVQPAVLYNI